MVGTCRTSGGKRGGDELLTTNKKKSAKGNKSSCRALEKTPMCLGETCGQGQGGRQASRPRTHVEVEPILED